MDTGSDAPFPFFTIIMLGLWWARIMTDVLLPVLGLTGNLLSAILLLRPRLSRNPTAFFMVVLAGLDSGALVFGPILTFLPTNYFLSGIFTNWVCKVTQFAFRVCVESSNWTVALMSVERAVAIAIPMWAKKLNKSIFKQVSVGTAVFCIAGYYSQLLVFTYSNNGICMFYNERYNSAIIYMSEFIVFTLFPALIIIAANGVIIAFYSKSVQVNLSEGQSGNSKSKTSRSLVKMLITISVAFVLLKLPFFLLITSKDPIFDVRQIHNQTDAYVNLMSVLLIWLFYLNNSINFYLYVISGKQFKKELSLLCCGRHGSQNKTITESSSVGE